jgi:hypothetical protein
MKMPSYKKFNKEIVDKIEKRLYDGEHFTIDDLMKDYLGEPEGQLAKILNRKRAEAWMDNLKTRAALQGDFVCVVDVDEDGKKLFGLVNTEPQARFAMHQYYSLTKGIVRSAMHLNQDIKGRGFLKGQVTNETLMLPKVKGS